MFDDLLIHGRTRKQLVNLAAHSSHGVILTGPAGSGKFTLARILATELLGLKNPEALDTYPYYLLIDPDANVITIDEVRAAQKTLTLKTPDAKAQAIRRVIIVVEAERMRHEAQNAFLKTLEEPPADTCIILTSEGSGGLLPTIYSRLQRVEVLPVSESAAKDYYSARGAPSVELGRCYAISQGQVGLLDSLIKNGEHELRVWVNTAKQLLATPTGERLLKTDELSRDKAAVSMLLNALGRIAHAALLSASKAGKTPGIKRWHSALSQINDANKTFARNANTKLLLDNLFLNL